MLALGFLTYNRVMIIKLNYSMNKKKSIFLFLLIIVLTGCFNKETQTPGDTNQVTPQASSSSLSESATKQNTATTPTKDSVTKPEDSSLQSKTEHEKNTNSPIKSSCNNIDNESTCMEYIGDIWTDELMKTSCKEANSLSNESCANDFAGGCSIGAGTTSEMITWYYLRGKGEISTPSLNNLEKICNMNPKGKWIAK